MAVVAGLLLLACRGGGSGLDTLPNILRDSDSKMFTYDAANATDPRPRCQSLDWKNVTSLTRLGYIGDIHSDITASSARVVSEGDVPVYEGERGPPNRTRVLVVRPSESCYVVYNPMA